LKNNFKMKEKIKNILIFLVILLFVFFLVFAIFKGWISVPNSIGSVGIVSAFEFPDYFNKSYTCIIFNISGNACELFWCEVIKEGNYSIVDEMCFFNNFQNYSNQNVTNNTNNSVIVLDIANLTINGFNFSDYMRNNFTIDGNFTIKSYIDNKTALLRDSILNSEENRTREIIKGELVGFNYKEKTSSNDSLPKYIYVLLIIVFMVAVLISIFLKKREEKNKNTDSYSPSDSRKHPYKSEKITKNNSKNCENEIEEFEETGVPPEKKSN